MANVLRIGMMGGGWPARRHAEGFLTQKGIELAAIAEPNRERRAEFVQAYAPGIQEYDDYRAMLKKADLDVAVVNLPTGMHHKASRAAIASGAHVLCEKPPATNAKEMLSVARAAEKAGIIYMFGRQPRFQPSVLKARQLAMSGKLGNIYHAETRWIRCRNIPWGAGGWFVNKAKGGGVLLDLGVHAIDTAWFVMGCPRPVEAIAGLHCAFSYLAPKGVEYTAEDAAIGLLRFENGATLHFLCTFALNTGYGTQDMSGLVNPNVIEASVYGDRGGVDILQGRLFTGRGQKGVMVSPFAQKQLERVDDLRTWPGRAPTFAAQAREFVRAVRAKDEPLNSTRQAVMLMQMLDALRKSGEKRRAVRIKSFHI